MITSETSFKLLNIWDGDYFSNRDGVVNNHQLEIQLQIRAALNSKLLVNGEEVIADQTVFHCPVTLKKGENTIHIVDQKSGHERKLVVYYLDTFEKKYRLSIDDCIWFLKDLHEHRHQYKSLFDNPYLKFLKQLHEDYETKIHLNLFYSTEDFNLSEMTDQYKSEWESNADWIQLSFHAESEFPDMPYVDASYQKVEEDCAKVHKEILRFAGPTLLSTTTTVHWGSANLEGCRALKVAGYKSLVGYFNVDDDLPPVSYYLSTDQRRHLKQRYIWRDKEEDLLFVRASMVVDTVALEEIDSHLNKNADEEGRLPRFADFLVHEQYFYSHYFNYQRDYRDRIIAAVKWAKKNGYTSAFVENSFKIK
ncbi:hypothetical protein [Membranihabitans marinus]|uniref:hypothetical protein n=1 Tax=Membranihabitans marinus TaxID=1227546 RepID=UPI001F4128AF|nr:hypothetical protein [Membranihabitans marinus]